MAMVAVPMPLLSGSTRLRVASSAMGMGAALSPSVKATVPPLPLNCGVSLTATTVTSRVTVLLETAPSLTVKLMVRVAVAGVSEPLL